jgi:oxaloacetate decarboxylase gamma subunit
MTINEMLAQSGILTLLGMGVVFGFLIILVFIISQFGRIINSGDKNKTETAPAVQTSAVSNAPAADNAQVTAAISAAVNEYRKTH